jgi:hypothetical protein
VFTGLIFFDGIYRLQRREDDQSKPDDKRTEAWRVRIINLSISQPDVKHLRPIIIVATRTNEGIFRTTCAESIGKRICRDFNLKINEILWIEHYPDESVPMYVAAFVPKSYIGPEIFYSVDWRPIRSNEIEAIRPFIPEVENVTGF